MPPSGRRKGGKVACITGANSAMHPLLVGPIESRGDFDEMHEEQRGGALPASGRSTAGDFAERACAHVRQMAQAGESRGEILGRLTAAAEAMAGAGAVASILVLDEGHLLRNGASPNLPADYLEAIDGLKPDALVGTCAAAAATGTVIVTPDFRADEKWGELRHLPLALGFVGAWSMPITSPEGTVLGTFGTYFREHRSPTPEERRGVELLAAAAAWVLANC